MNGTTNIKQAATELSSRQQAVISVLLRKDPNRTVGFVQKGCILNLFSVFLIFISLGHIRDGSVHRYYQIETVHTYTASVVDKSFTPQHKAFNFYVL
jgi:hypothetical protein